MKSFEFNSFFVMKLNSRILELVSFSWDYQEAFFVCPLQFASMQSKDLLVIFVGCPLDAQLWKQKLKPVCNLKKWEKYQNLSKIQNQGEKSYHIPQH